MRAVFFGLGADGTVGANKNSIKIIGEETENDAQGYFVYDSKKSGAITISHLRFGPGPIRSSYLIKKANFVACHQFGFLERYDMLEYAVPGGTFLLNSPYPEGRGLEAPAPQGPGADRREEAQVLRHRRLRRGREDRHGRPHQLDHADLLLRDLRRPAPRGGDRADQEGDREDLRQEGRGGRQAQLRLGGRDPREPPRGPGRRAHRHREDAADRAPDGARLRQARAGGHHRGQGRPAAGQRLPRGRHLAHRHRAVGEARRSRSRSPSGTTRSASSATSARSSAPTRPSARRSTTATPSPSAPATFKSTDFKGAEFKGKKYTIQVAPEDCTGCNLCVMVCPAKDKSNPKHKAIDMAPMPPLREAERGELRVLPRPARAEARGGQARPQGHAVPDPALRVLGRLRRLRRDPVHQADDAALRRPRAHRERHRLLLDLRRQPPHHPLRAGPQRPRPRLVELALRGQRRVRLRHAARPRPAQGAGGGPRERPRRQARRQPGEGPPRGRPVRRGRHRGAARARPRPQAGAREDPGHASRSGCCCSPTTS